MEAGVVNDREAVSGCAGLTVDSGRYFPEKLRTSVSSLSVSENKKLSGSFLVLKKGFVNDPIYVPFVLIAFVKRRHLGFIS